MKKTISFTSIFVLLMLLIPSFTFANAGFDDEVLDTPIDGGLCLLVAAGVGYGAKKLKAKRNNTMNVDNKL